MRQFPVLLIAVILAGLSAPALPRVAAQELPDFVIHAVAQVSAYIDRPLAEEQLISQGSGVFVDNGGCLYTNTHVVIDLSTGEPYPHIAVKMAEKRSGPPVFAFEAEVIYADQSVDLAYLCPIQETRLFTHFFERLKESSFDRVAFGKDVWVMGFPGAGAGTVTVSPGHIVGFIEDPDVREWIGVPQLDTKKLRLYKTDALSGPGVSGGLLIDRDLRLIGVPFAGSFFPGAFIFVLSEDVYLQFEQNIRRYFFEEGLVPLDCVYDPQSEYYHRAGLAFYDRQCAMPYDETMEREVRATYRAFCGQDIPQFRLVPGIRRSKQLGDLGQWSDNVLMMCAQGEISGNPVNATPALSAGDFAYGKARLSDLESENALAEALTIEIDLAFPHLRLPTHHWTTIINAYIYGGYSLPAIIRAIELGGYTVHPTIPFESWRNSRDYQEKM
jgi:hypothetical protein